MRVREAMSTRSLRRNRISSRLSSPAITGDAEQADDSDADMNGDGGGDEWVEPPVRRMPPSYQDHKGLERVGVLELQQPLGEPPSQKLLQRLKLNFVRSSNRASPLQNEEGVTPSVESERPEFGSPREAERLSQPPLQELPLEEPVIATSPPRGRPAKRDADEMRQPVYMMDISPFHSSAPATPQMVVAPRPISIQEQLRQDRVSAYIERAIDEAERNGDIGLLPGLHRVKDKAFKQRSLWVVLEAIAHNSPNEEQLSIFKRYIKKGVKRHRRASALSDALQGKQSQSPAVPAVSSHNTLSPATATPNPAPTFTSPFRTRPSSSQLAHTHPANPPVHLSPSSRRGRMDTVMDPTPEPAEPSNEPRRRRSGSQSSTSSLSSAKSIPDAFVEDEAGIADERAQATSVHHGGAKGSQRQGSDRAKLRSSGVAHHLPKHPFHAFPDVAKITAKKLKKPREELDYDPAEVEQRRKRFEADSYQNYNYKHHKTVDLRERAHIVDSSDDDDDDETPVIPKPVVHAHPVISTQTQVDPSFGSQVGPEKTITNGTSRKRTHYDMEADDAVSWFSKSVSPELDVPPPPPPPLSARLASRAGTPRIAKNPVIAKARKSARVMIS